MSQNIDDKTKLKRIIACSRDVIVSLLDKEIIVQFLPEDLADTFVAHSETLVKSIETNSTSAINAIDLNHQKLKDEGLSEDELEFKYAYFNKILTKMEMPVTLNDYNDKEVNPNGEKSNLKRMKDFFRGIPVSPTGKKSNLKRMKDFFRGIPKMMKKKVKVPVQGKIIDWVLGGINWILTSIGNALPGIGARSRNKECYRVRKEDRR